MRYVSLFSGIEAASVAWKNLGWEPVGFSEIEPFCCSLLAERFPDVPNFGDITKIKWEEVVDEYGAIDLVVGGSPCQSFSVAGTRESLRGESRLMFEYIRAVRELRPKWFLWENVPGALTAKGLEGEKGGAFKQLLRELCDLGYCCAWRVLDAQFFGVAQRRRRVFLVGCLGSECSAEVLFEPESVRGDIKSSKAKRAELAARAGRGADGVHGDSCLTPYDGQCVRVFDPYSNDAAPTLQAAAGESGTPSKTIIEQRYEQGAFLPNAGAKARGIGYEADICPTLMTGCQVAVNQHVVENCPVAHQQSFEDNRKPCFGIQGDGTTSLTAHGRGYNEELAFTENLVDRHSVCVNVPFSKTHRGMSSDDATVYENTELANTLNTFDMGESRANEIVAFTQNTRNEVRVIGDGTYAGALSASSGMHQTNYVCSADGGDGEIDSCRWVVRRLTPTECERLQGFPDGWTAIDGAKDSPRYKALGNSMAVPVMRWIGERIAAVDENEKSL